jgi:hypothetical protein
MSILPSAYCPLWVPSLDSHGVRQRTRVQDSDDLYFDADRKVPTAIGAKTAGYYKKQGKGFDRFYLAVPARDGQSAEVRIYTVQD